MKCPACAQELASVRAGSLTVDVCQMGCGGVWFDLFELAKLEKQPESAHRALEHYNRPTGLAAPQSKKRPCPRCQDIVMMRRFFSRLRGVEIDECAGCGGIWLDGGELEAIKREAAQLEAGQPLTEGAARLVQHYLRSLGSAPAP
jgi:hypothetical protein